MERKVSCRVGNSVAYDYSDGYNNDIFDTGKRLVEREMGFAEIDD